MDTREDDYTQGRAWAHSRMEAIIALYETGLEGLVGPEGWSVIPWDKPIPPREDQRQALLRLGSWLVGRSGTGGAS